MSASGNTAAAPAADDAGATAANGLGALRPALRRLIETVAATRVTELSVEQGGASIRLRRAPHGAVAAESRLGGPAEAPAVEGGVATIQAGLVGTFYRAPRAGQEPLVQVGQRVAAGQPVGVIAAMELVNDVTAPIAGTVRQIVAEDGAAVEYGQPLVILDPIEPP